MVAAVSRTIFAQPDATTVAATWDEVGDQLTDRFPEIGPLMDGAKAEVLAFTAFPRPHWSKTGRPTLLSGWTRRSSAVPTFMAQLKPSCVTGTIAAISSGE
jgi:putative transposase